MTWQELTTEDLKKFREKKLTIEVKRNDASEETEILTGEITNLGLSPYPSGNQLTTIFFIELATRTKLDIPISEVRNIELVEK